MWPPTPVMQFLFRLFIIFSSKVLAPELRRDGANWMMRSLLKDKNIKLLANLSKDTSKRKRTNYKK